MGRASSAQARLALGGRSMPGPSELGMPGPSQQASAPPVGGLVGRGGRGVAVRGGRARGQGRGHGGGDDDDDVTQCPSPRVSKRP